MSAEGSGAGRWLELSARVDNEAVEAVCEVFRRHVHGGVVVERVVEGGEYDWTEEPDAAAVASVPVVVRGYLPVDAATAVARRTIEEALWHLNVIWPVPGPTARVVEEADWANAWKAHFQVHRVGERLVIRPPWHDYAPAERDVVIDLDPGMAFGTGLHPTTQMCLRAVERLVRPGMRALDLGTGSGILAIAAAKFGAAVEALDIDPVAVRVANENVGANGVGADVRVEQGSLPREAPRCFDLVLANIIARVISDLAVHFRAVMAEDGRLVASGIIADREPEVANRLVAAGWSIVERERQGDWVTLEATLGTSGPTVR